MARTEDVPISMASTRGSVIRDGASTGDISDLLSRSGIEIAFRKPFDTRCSPIGRVYQAFAAGLVPAAECRAIARAIEARRVEFRAYLTPDGLRMVRKGWFVSIKLSEQQLAFLSETRFGVLATVNADGSPQQTVMWYLPVDNRTILMNTKKRRVKDKNLERDPRVSLLVEDGQRYVAVRGRISVDDDATRGQETMRTITTRYEGAETAARQMEELYSKQHRITLTLDIESIDTHGFDE